METKKNKGLLRYLVPGFIFQSVVIGGGYPTTELRQMSDRTIFSYVDYIILDDGERALEHILNGEEPTGTITPDGYRDGYFHINWGWSGVSNGYFLLWSLDPDVQGTGGSSSGNGFDFYQDILTARPAEAGDVAVPQVLCGGSFGVDTTSATRWSSPAASGTIPPACSTLH